MSVGRRSTVLRWLGYAVSAAVVGWLLLVVLPELGELDQAGQMLLTGLTVPRVAAIVGVLALYQLTHALTLTTAEPRLSLPSAALVRAVSGGISRLVPAGWALGIGATFTMLRARGIPATLTARAVAITGVWNTLTKLSLPLLGLIVVGTTGTAPLPRGPAVAAATAGILVVAVAALWVLTREGVGRWIGQVVERPIASSARLIGREPPSGLSDSVVAFQDSAGEALRRRPLAMAGWYYAHHLTQVSLVWIGMHVAGTPVTGFAEVLLAFALGYLLTGLPISPGGLGTLDVIVVASLIAVGEDGAIASSGLLVYRVATYALYVPALAAWPLWQRSRRPPAD